MLVGQEHQFFEALLVVLYQVACVSFQFFTEAEVAQVGCLLEGVLANLRHRCRQDERLYGLTVVEHVFSNPVFLFQIFVHTPQVVRVLRVLVQVGIV